MLHILLIQATALAVWYLRDGAMGAERLVFALDVGMLYFVCRWYADSKATQPRRWMRYV